MTTWYVSKGLREKERKHILDNLKKLEIQHSSPYLVQLRLSEGRMYLALKDSNEDEYDKQKNIFDKLNRKHVEWVEAEIKKKLR